MHRSGEPRRELRVVSSQIELEDISGRVLFPTPTQGPWIPFVRFAETVATGGEGDTGGHAHRGEEVMNYILDGPVEYQDDRGHRSVLERGAVVLLTAIEKSHHNLVPKSATRSRWLSVVVQCPVVRGAPPHRVQIAPGPIPARPGDGTLERRLVGREAPVVSASGLECVDIEFARDGRCVCPVGTDRRAVAYVYEGSGQVDDLPVGAGAGALLENAADVSFRAGLGTRVLLASAPRTEM